MKDVCIYPRCMSEGGPAGCPHVKAVSAAQPTVRDRGHCPHPVTVGNSSFPTASGSFSVEVRWNADRPDPSHEPKPCQPPEPVDSGCCQPDPCPPCPGNNGPGQGSGTGPNPKRPGRPQGGDTGRSQDPTPVTSTDINSPNPPGVWIGPRKDLYLPYLFIRANAGDTGKRPVVGPFWESPDIFLLAGVDPSLAPNIPPQLGQIANAGEPNTIYAHVWNFGNCAASEVVVEFYWCDPSLGINAQSTHLIAQTVIALGAKGSGRAHALVKCPKAWIPTFLNGGHECLLVRVWDNTADLPGEPKFDASINRHVGQRNIHVAAPVGAQPIVGPTIHPLIRRLQASTTGPALANPIVIKVGPLYGQPAQVAVERVSPNNVPWLQLRGGRGVFPVQAAPTGTPALSVPHASTDAIPTSGFAQQHQVVGDDQQVALVTSDTTPAAGQAHIYRVSAIQGGVVFGGYTVVITG